MTKKIVVGTDFSSRSDRAIRRATILAKSLSASLTLVHAVDDDQAPRLVETGRAAAEILLAEQVLAIRQIDGVACQSLVVFGDASTAFLQACKDLEPDLAVIGPHRRHLFRDVFVGTTAERAIRVSRQPVLMANGTPAGEYRHVLLAVDLSTTSAAALNAVNHLGLDRKTALSVLYVFDAPVASTMLFSGIGKADVADYVRDHELRASQELNEFLQRHGTPPATTFVRRADRPIAPIILQLAHELGADLVAVGTHGRTGLMKMLLGSVAEQVLRDADVDVLTVPSAPIS
jgi:Universal stress protein UspA and related nucleotide-binding proteins